MDLYQWIWIGILVSFYGVPLATGLCVTNPRTVILLAIASFCGLYASIWSLLGPLFVPLVGALITRYEMSAILTLSFLAGVIQAVLVALAGMACRQLLSWLRMRVSDAPASHSAA
jgi:hypothetical protein